MNENCLFCKIVAGGIPAKKVAETGSVLAFEDITPQAPTHILLIPKKHIESNLALEEEDKDVVGEIHLLANKIAEERGLDKTGFRLVTNVGADGGQAVFHIHFHLLGGRAMTWPPG